MRKVKIAGVLLISSLILISIGNLTVAQDSSYVGVSEGEEYIWDLGLNKEGINSLKDDTELLVAEILNNISTLDLGAYTDLNASEAMLLAYSDSIDLINDIFPPGLIPDDWKTLNLSTLMEDLIDQVVETFNSSFLQGEIPYDWKSENIVSFFDHVIDGLNKTTPGLDNFTLGEVIETLINVIDDSCPIELLPEGWEDMPISNLIKLYLGYPLDFINTTILPGMIPTDWLHMDLAQLLQNVLPILPQELIDLLAASYAPYPGGISIFTFFDQNAQSLNYSLGGLIPGNWDDYSIPELIFPLLLQGWEDYNLTYTFYELFEAINSSAPFDLYATSMSSLINMTISSITMIFPTEIQSMPILDLLRNGTSSYLLLMNYTYTSSGIFPDNWMSLTIDNLRDYYINQGQILFEQYMVEFDNYLAQFELLGGFQKFSLKAIIDHIGDETELIPGGPKGVPIKITIEIKLPWSDWIKLTDILGIDIFDYYSPIYILDPTTFSVDKGALIEQFLSTGGLFIGKNYDWSDIATVYEFPGPDPGKLINFEMEWNSNGVLDHILLEYGEQEIASIELRTPSPPPPEPPTITTQSQTINTNDIVIEWTAVNGVDNYSVYIDGSYYQTTTDTQMSITLEGDGTYIITVTANNIYGESDPSNEITIIVELPAPSPPGAIGGINIGFLLISSLCGFAIVLAFIKHKKK